MFSNKLEKLEEAVICLLLVATTLLVFAEVIMRFVFATGVLWAQEATLHLSAWMVLFGVSYGVKKGAHIGVDVLVSALPEKAKRIAGLVAIGACLGYVGLIGYGSWVYLSKIKRVGIPLEDIPIAKWQAQCILVIGMVMLGWRLLELAYRTVKGTANGFSFTDEAAEVLHELEDKKDEQGK